MILLSGMKGAQTALLCSGEQWAVARLLALELKLNVAMSCGIQIQKNSKWSRLRERKIHYSVTLPSPVACLKDFLILIQPMVSQSKELAILDSR